MNPRRVRAAGRKAAAYALVAALLTGTTVALPCRADDPPDSQTLRARSDAVYGPKPTAWRETIEFSGTASSGTRVIYQLGANHREVIDAGPLHNEYGIYRGDHWHQNQNGHVVIDEDDPGLATQELMKTTVTRTKSPFDAYVIATLNEKGSGTRDFIDPQTFYVVRREDVAPNGKTTTVYDDFRAFGTRHLAAHWTVHDEKSGTDTQYWRRAYAVSDVADADVAIPVIKHALVEYPAGQDRVVLPAVFEPSGHILVRLTIAGRGLDFVLDTGASGIVLDPGVASQLGLTVINKMQSSVNAGRYATGTAIVPSVGVGALTMHNVVVSIDPLGWEEPGARDVGLLGFDFLCESGITIDYEHQQVTAERYGSYATPADPKMIALDVRLGNQQPLTTASINGEIAERMGIDTGGAGSFLIFDYFVRRHPNTIPRDKNRVSNIHFSGAGGAFDTTAIEIDSLLLGKANFRHFIGYKVNSASSYSGQTDGVIGPAFLHFFDVHLDYPNGKIYLVPNATGRHAMH